MRKIKLLFSALMLLAGAVAFAQNITVKGVVSDGAGDPIPAAAVIIDGTTKGTTTGIDGVYTINVPANATLVFSSIGYAEQKVAVNGKTVVNVVLSEDAQLLDETIVVAFGTSTKESFTGSAKVVKSDELAKAQVSAVTSALAGQVAGVQLAQSTGQPGTAPTIRIRGFSSLNAGKDPLYVVDGVPYDGAIGRINPADVESMTVLKDAASNALYGARGANGVIIITTKKSKSKDAIVTVDAKYGVNTKALKDYDYINSVPGYYEAHALALRNYYMHEKGMSIAGANLELNNVITGPQSSGGLGYQVYDVPAGEAFIGANGKINPGATLGRTITAADGSQYWVEPDNWNDYAYRNGVRQEYNVSVSAGSTRSNFYASLGYLNNQGITAKSDQTRITGRLKADYQAKSWLKVYGNMAYTKYDNNSFRSDYDGSSNSTSNLWAFTSQIAPIYPLFVRNADKSIKIDQWGFEMMDYGDGMNAGLSRPFMPNANPLFANKVDTRYSEGNAINASGAADITFLRHFKFTVNANENVDEYRFTSVSNPYYGQFASSKGSVSKQHIRSAAFNTQQLLNYEQDFGHLNVGVMVGHEYYNTKGYVLYASKQNMYSQDNKELDGAVKDNSASGSYTTEYNVEGYFSRAQADYDGKYFASASFRRDASSHFAVDHRWGNFWSLGGAWIVSKEDFFGVDWVNNLKLKASIGSQGNDDIGSYQYTDTYTIAPSAGEVSVAFEQKGNPNITWETNTNFNVGTEFTLFDGVLDGSVEYFKRTTTDMLFWFATAPSVGYTGYYDNVGDMYNKGVEFSLTANLINTKDMHLAVNFNATHYKNKITSISDELKTLTVDGVDGYNSGSYFIGEGVPIYTRYLKKYAGVDKSTGKSLWYKNVTDEDGVTSKVTTDQWSDADYYLADSSIPDLYGGLGISFDWKGIDFSINCSYQIGGKIFDNGYQSLMGSPVSGSTGSNYHKDLLKSWSEDNPGSNIPRFQYGDLYANASSDRWLTSSSYLNIENINVGYTFPSKLTSKVGISSLRVYAACENVFYWSKRQGLDPRTSYSGESAYTAYLPIRTISGGVTFKF